MEFEFRGYKVRLFGATPTLWPEILHSKFVTSWLLSLDTSLILQSIDLQSFTKSPTGLFTCIKISTVCTRLGMTIPRIIILHGPGAVALIVIRNLDLGRDFVLFYERPRVATGSFQLEAPLAFTGGAEPDANFTSDFVARETGLVSDAADWVDLLLATRGSDGVTEGIRPFDRPSDQRIRIWLLEREMHDGDVRRLDGRAVGPNVTIRILPLEDAARLTTDNKNMSAALFYEIYCEMRRGK
jgi:hypothetical protein